MQQIYPRQDKIMRLHGPYERRNWRRNVMAYAVELNRSSQCEAARAIIKGLSSEEGGDVGRSYSYYDVAANYIKKDC